MKQLVGRPARLALARPRRAWRARFAGHCFFTLSIRTPSRPARPHSPSFFCYLHPQSTNTVLTTLFPAHPFRSTQSASPRSQSQFRPYSPYHSVATNLFDCTDTPTRSSTKLDLSYDGPNSRTALSRLTILNRVKESTCRTFLNPPPLTFDPTKSELL
jgi:hypothetical protein